MKLLIVKLSSLGDVVQTMAVVADIHAHLKDQHKEGVQIDWVVEEAFAPLVARVEGIVRVIPIAQRRWRKNWQRSFWKFASPVKRQISIEKKAFLSAFHATTYDAVIDFQGLIKSALVARQARRSSSRAICGTYGNKSELCGYEWPVRYLLPDTVAMERRLHAIDRYRLLAARLLKYSENLAPAKVRFTCQPSPFLPITDGKTLAPAATKKVWIAYGTTRADNEWPQSHWLGLARQFAALGWQCVLPQANEHEKQWVASFVDKLERDGENGVQQSAKLSQPDALHNVAPIVLPQLALDQVLDAMAQCQAVVGVDSGLTHMAVALNLPTVMMFSQDRSWRAGPKPLESGGVAHQVVVGGAVAPSVDQVLAAFLAVQASS